MVSRRYVCLFLSFFQLSRMNLCSVRAMCIGIMGRCSKIRMGKGVGMEGSGSTGKLNENERGDDG